MDNKLSELSKPVAWTDSDAVDILKAGKWAPVFPEKYQDSFPLYSQEYVSALLAEIERGNGYLDDVRYAKGCCENAIAVREKRIAELEAKLATPVRLPGKTSDLDDWDGGWNACLDECAEAIRSAGFTVEGDE